MKDKLPYIIIGVLIGVIIMQWQQGPQPAQAQAPEPTTGYRVQITAGSTTTYHFVMLSNGDVYTRSSNDNWSTNPPQYMGNFWGTFPVPTSNSSWGGIKGKLGDGN